MALVSISEAARRAGLSRTQLYRGYIKPGKLSTVTPPGKSPQIDTSELQRVFGELSPVSATAPSAPLRPGTSPKNDTETALLKQEVRFLREQLQMEREHNQELKRSILLLEHKVGASDQEQRTDAAAEQREHLLLAQVESLTDAVKRLELQSQQPPPQPPRRGFWSRLFGRN